MKSEIEIPDSEKTQLLNFIFGDARALFENLTPDGWENSEYVRFFHPTPKQRFEEEVQINENINPLFKKDKNDTDHEEIKESDFEPDDLEGIRPYEEFLYVMGLSVYDIFSMNHEVTREDGAVYDLGSWRGSGGFLAGFFHNHVPETKESYTYMDFYMGSSISIGHRADLLPFYNFIFQKLKANKCDWTYSFPELGIVDFRKNHKEAKNDSPAEDYNPGQQVLEDLEIAKKDQELQNFKKELEDAHEKAVEKAKYSALPKTVQAYQTIFGHLPNGHPQKEFEG